MPHSPSPLLLESIRLEDGKAPLLARHQLRVDRSRQRYYGKAPAFKLAEVLEGLELPESGVHKLRLLYRAGLESYEILPYTVRPVQSLRIVEADDLRYSRKYADRSGIDALFARRENCDDVLIVQRQHITDSSYANLALYDGSRWYTPAWPLLQGTRRAELIHTNVLQPSVIRVKDLANFERIRLVNSMMDWEDGPTVRITAVLGY
ncbi:4-amino-4-deoxychorismate lyase [Neolewinella xylanilytica]|uniref:4-amino-4-deoxychorismate lyase n=1 Tax=Neolewinella xylanilytica TaxID=1514080 RepID=A0A2S6I679_9BACT|nr:aminotransferase class IV [Neolewinella xylanilytica]PPK86672.1 4-amino-4-deoxychorismate lyase [Neolewinella xylanilytica]